MGIVNMMEHKGKKIHYFDFTGLLGDELLNALKLTGKIIDESGKDDNLVIANYTNTYANDEVMAFLKSAENKRTVKKIKKSAVIGIAGVKKILLNAYNSISGANSKAVNTMEEAKKFIEL